MNLGDVTRKTVPKMCLVSRAAARRRHRDAHVHSASRARGDRRARRGQRGDGLRDSRARWPTQVAQPATGNGAAHRSRASDRILHRRHGRRARRTRSVVRRSALLRTARKLMRGEVFVPGAVVEPRMNTPCSVCLLGFGEVGQALAADLRPRVGAPRPPGICSSRMPPARRAAPHARLEGLAAADVSAARWPMRTWSSARSRPRRSARPHVRWRRI